MMLLRLLRLELLKLRFTLATTLCLVAPTLVALVATVIALRQPGTGWSVLVTNSVGLWAYFVLPMTTAALAALVAQVEHGPRCWDHLFALPIRRSPLIIAKALVLMLMLGAMSALLLALCFALGVLAGALGSIHAAAGDFPWPSALAMLAASWLASWLMAILQLWVALRFRSFVPPIALGLAGTFVVVAAMGAPQSVVIPWAMPLAALGLPGGNPAFALLAGGLGGIALMFAMAAHLARSEL
jgi:ABC-2 type transport system permease protein